MERSGGPLSSLSSSLEYVRVSRHRGVECDKYFDAVEFGMLKNDEIFVSSLILVNILFIFLIMAIQNHTSMKSYSNQNMLKLNIVEPKIL